MSATFCREAPIYWRRLEHCPGDVRRLVIKLREPIEFIVEQSTGSGDHDWAEIYASRRLVPDVNNVYRMPFIYAIARGLANNDITGPTANDFIGEIFWQYFVLDDEGLAWLHQFARVTWRFYYLERVKIEAHATEIGNEVWEYWTKNSPDGIRQRTDAEFRTMRRAIDRINTDDEYRHAVRAAIIAVQLDTFFDVTTEEAA